MAQKLDAKEVGLLVLEGSGIVIGTAIISGFMSGLGFAMLDFSIIPNYLTIGTAIAAGISAFGIGYLVDTYIRK